MRTPLEQIAFQLKNNFDGNPWYGDALMDVLNDVDQQQAASLLEGRSILRLLCHMLAWRMYVLHQLQGDADFNIELGSEADWPSDDSMDWVSALQALQDNQEALLTAIGAFPQERLLEKVPGRPFNFAFMLEGLAQHDIYHLGQIALLKRLVQV